MVTVRRSGLTLGAATVLRSQVNSRADHWLFLRGVSYRPIGSDAVKIAEAA